MLKTQHSKSDNLSQDPEAHTFSSDTTEAAVNPDMLAWARLTAGLTKAATLIRIPELSVECITGYEQGTEKPTWALLKKFSSAYNRPVSSFFLDTPPVASRKAVASVSIRYDDGSDDVFSVAGDDNHGENLLL